jgi:hypothetical protein
MIRRRNVLLTVAVAGLCCLPALQAGTIVIPGADAGTEAASNNGFPFNIASFALSSQRYQQVYGASAFSGPILITGMDFRPDVGGAAFSSTLPSIQIDLSTTSAAVDALSTTFASNVGLDDVTVYAAGPLALSSAFTGPGGGPKAFDIHIAFTTPFAYNPLNGNLLLDVRNFGGGTTTQFDADSTLGDAISRVYTTGSGVGSTTADASSTDGLVTQFDFGAAVPEPSTALLSGVSLMGLLLIGRARARFKTRS